MAINYSFELYEFNEALTPYGTIETKSPSRDEIVINDFTSGTHFRTGPEGNGSNALVLELEDRLLTIILDESGSMTWNDSNGDRYTYFTRLLTKLRDTYPGEVLANLIGFGGTLAVTKLLVTQATTDFLSSGEGQDLNLLLQDTFQDSVYDFAGVRVVRRSDRYPTHPADGIIVGEGILDAVKDESLIEGQTYYYGVWTFNKDLNFSSGRFISGAPQDRILPQGVNFSTATPRILPGVTRDKNTQVIYNFLEGSGSTVFDSSGQGHHAILGSEVIEDNFWLGDAASISRENGGESKKPVGVRFDGEFDILEAPIGDEIAYYGDIGLLLTVNFWVYRYKTNADTWIIGTGQENTSNVIGWAFTINSTTGAVQLTTGDITSARSPFPSTFGTNNIPTETWTMVTVVLDSNAAKLYINGSLIGQISGIGSLDLRNQESLIIGAFPTDSSVSWTGTDFFGSLAQISIHDIARDSSYISSLFINESLIFDQPLQGASESPPDNTQREVVLSWNVGEDFDFEGGEIKIVRKYREIPSHDNDGVLVLQQPASAGQFYYIDSYDFVNNADYYYRIFTINALGNVCDRSDARVNGVHIPVSPLGIVTPAPSPVSNVSVINGNKKVMLQWSNPSDSNWKGTKIYFGADQFPTISFSGQGKLEVSNGFEVFDTQDSSQEIFVHRKIGIDNNGVAIPLENGKFHYYTIVTYDRYGFLSDAEFITGIPSGSLSTVFPPAEVNDLHLTIVNPKTLSIQWTTPIVRTDNLQLFFGESALIFVSIKDIFGGNLDDLVNIKLQVCTEITNRDLTAQEKALGILGPGDALDGPCGNPNIVMINGGCKHGARLEDDCNNEQEEAETVLNFSAVESGLIKGILTHTSDASILTRRERYEMSVRAQYVIEDPKTNELLFILNTEAVNVSFQHPLKMALVNKDKRTVTPPCGNTGKIRGQTICPQNCDEGIRDGSDCNPETVNGTYINASKPYVCRVELQYKGEALPAGTPVNVRLFKSSEDTPLQIKSSRVSIREGIYNTTVVQEALLDSNNNPTGDVINKSIVDIEIPAPALPEKVDIYVSIQYLGFFVDGIHSLEFIGSLFIQVDANQPFADGISVAEQIATAWMIDPDNPDNPDAMVPVPDGTLIKWELVKLRHGKDRPFYSTEPINELISGVYSSTINGVARNVFFGPISNIESHEEEVCGFNCCIGEEYAVKASVIHLEQQAVDAMYIAYPCQEDEELLRNNKMFMNAQVGQPGESPNYITWADGEHLLRFSIAKNPAIVTDAQIPGATCFRNCLETAFDQGSQLIPFPEGHVVQVTAPAEILWNVKFGDITEETTGTGNIIDQSGSNLLSFELATIPENQNTTTAGIPINGDVTDFYVRLNKFIGDSANPQPEDCRNSGTSGGIGGSGNVLLNCEWENICKDSAGCFSTSGVKWTGVNPIFAQSTFITDNGSITLTGGGGYDTGMPPILIGFKEPLDVNIIEARINGQRLDTQELIVDGVSQHTIVVEVKFANKPVPDGTVVELFVDEPNTNVIRLSNCQTENVQPGCNPAATGIIYTSQVNDPFINPDGDKRSLAYFTIDPLPNIAFNGKINVTCRYDKLGTVEREITRCVELNNTINVDTPNPEQPPTEEPPPVTSVTSNEAIVYDTVADLYSTTNGGSINRMGHFTVGKTSGTTSNIYSISGYTDRDIDGTARLSPTAEKFDVASATWSFISDIPTPRTSGMTVLVGDFIYCIGGLELDPIVDQYRVSRKIECYDTISGTWNPSLSPMPEDNGVAFGDAQYDNNDNIYVLCGVTKVVNNNQPNTLNERILRYTISTDTWTIIQPSNISEYKRIAPFGFFRDNPLPIFEQSINHQIQNGGDDAENSWDGWKTTENQLQVGRISNQSADLFFRFPINIRPNRVIISATLTLYAYNNDTTDDCKADIYLLDLDNTPEFNDITDLSGTATYGPGIRWDLTNELLVAGAASVSPDIKSIIQSFVNRSGYSVGNYIGIKLDGSATTVNGNFRTVSSVEDTLSANATLDVTYLDGESEEIQGYIYGGSIPKTLSEINAEYQSKLNQALNDFRSFILTSPYYLSLTASEQADFIESEEKKIADSIIVAPYIYPATGFKYKMGSEHLDSSNNLIIDISDKIDDEWSVLPLPRDRGKCVYISSQDTAYFMGGSNQNKSTTLNRVESIDLAQNANIYLRLTPFSRGRSLFGAVPIQDDIYLSGGLTSGHQKGYVEIDLKQGPTLVEAQGKQSSGIIITLRDDSGELIDQDIRCIVRGRLRIPEIDSVLASFLANRAADRALGGDGTGNAPDLSNKGKQIDFAALIEAQNSIINPNSDQFQFNAAKKLGEQVFLFPVLYSEQEITISGGIGGVTLLPRSEDPLADFQRLAQFIQETLASTPPDPNERFQGNLTREELAALGDALKTVQLPPTILDSNTIRDLYQIETIVTIVDDVYFGQTVSDFDLDIQKQINRKIEELLTPSEENITDEDNNSSETSEQIPFSGIPISESDCFLLQHVAAQEIPLSQQPPPPENNNQGPSGIGGQNQSGQCLFCQTLLPLKPSIKLQLPTTVATFYNATDWVPQIKKRLINGHTLDEVIEEIDIIDHEIPFGASQLYSAIKEAAIISTGEIFEARKKVFYIGSDNSENFSLISRDEAIDEINAVDGDGKSPVIYSVFSTSFPISLAAQLERTETGDIEKIVKATGGQSSTLISSGFLNQILNLTVGGATGGLGWGKYTRLMDLGELSAITDVTTNFILPLNTQGYLRFRYSQDIFNFSDWTERFEGSQTIDFVDFFARFLEFEIVLTTGFSTDITPEYDSTATGIPKLVSISWGISGEREDFIFLNKEDVLTNAQQVAASFNGVVPKSSIVEIGIASSNSHNWNDFQSSARPALSEFGKTFLLERTDDPFSLVPIEPLTTRNGLLYTTTYGPWDPTSTATLYKINTDGTEVPVLTGFRLYPRQGEVYFDARQDPSTTFKLAIVNAPEMRVGLRLRNRLHTDSISIQGIGYIYSTNDEKPVELSQVAPRAINVLISPQNPNINDTIFALYDYIDLNGDPEKGTIIKWFKNGSQLFEINNKTSWTNNDLQTNNKLLPNDKLYFSVTPSDGRDFGSTVFSPTVTVVALPPNAQDLTVIAIRNGLINDRYDTASTYQVTYTFNVADKGPNAEEFGTVIRWFVNGFLFKEGTHSAGNTYNESNLDPRQLSREEIGTAPGPNLGSRAHIIGNEILVEVTPKTVLVTGEQSVSKPFSVVNSIPIITSAKIEPAEPTTNSTLLFSYTIDDPDIDDEIESQTDQSEIKWFVSVDGSNFVENADAPSEDRLTVPPVFTSPGEIWKVQITGFDGLDLGPTVESNTVLILP